MAVYRERPALLTHTHRSKLFDGENALHILCVNSREDELVEAIELAASHLRRTQLDKLFHGQVRARREIVRKEEGWEGSSGRWRRRAPLGRVGPRATSFLRRARGLAICRPRQRAFASPRALVIPRTPAIPPPLRRVVCRHAVCSFRRSRWSTTAAP